MQVSLETVEQAVDERLKRLDTNCVDLLQFHWQEVRRPFSRLQVLLDC